MDYRLDYRFMTISHPEDNSVQMIFKAGWNKMDSAHECKVTALVLKVPSNTESNGDRLQAYLRPLHVNPK